MAGFFSRSKRPLRGVGDAPDRIEPNVEPGDPAPAPKRVHLDDVDPMTAENNAPTPDAADGIPDNVSDVIEELVEDAPDAGVTPGASVDAELEAARAEAAEWKDKYTRAHAEMENIKRRSDTEIAKARKYATEAMAKGMLDVRDSLDLARAVDLSSAGDEALPQMLEGLDITLKQFEAVFTKHSVIEINPDIGAKLDPELHQAMGTQPTADVPANHIAVVIQKGYQLHDRLLRPAMVMVAAAVPAPSENQGDADA